MSEQDDRPLDRYYQEAATWAQDRAADDLKSRRLAWIIAGIAGALALLEAIALVLLVPLRTVVPYTLLVDRQTGYVEELKPLERQTVTPDAALVRSFIAQYIIARESFDIDVLRETYRKVALWSGGEARSRYVASMQASNSLSPLATLPRRSVVEVQVRSLSSLSADTALVRYSTVRTDPGGQPQSRVHWAAVVKYRFSGEAMSAEDRLINPLGFQVMRYRRDAETLPEEAARANLQAPDPATMQPGGAGVP